MKLLVLDKDGTLTRTKSGHTFVQHPEDQVLINGVTEAIAAYTANGWTMAIASNQGGVAAGHKTLEQAIAEMQYAMKLTGLESSALFCPDIKGDQCWHVHSTEKGEVRHIAHPLHKNKNCENLIGLFRKPNGGMLIHLKNHFSTTWSENKFLMIGDRDEDFGAAVKAGFGYMHVSAWLEPFRKIR